MVLGYGFTRGLSLLKHEACLTDCGRIGVNVVKHTMKKSSAYVFEVFAEGSKTQYTDNVVRGIKFRIGSNFTIPIDSPNTFTGI